MKSILACEIVSAVVLATLAAPAAAQPGTAACRDNGDRSVTTCRIDQPVVDQRAQQGYPYKTVVFRPGDLVTVTAGGCVQTGGIGATWKRYVNPSGPDSNRYYNGTIRIPGAIPPGALAELRAWVDRPISIPGGVGPPDNVLVLGYRDENGGYGDNGYTGHDDGTDDQCKQGERRDGGPAWVVVTIEHGKGGATVPAPLDIVADRVDSNGLPLNPKWGWEASADSRKPPNSNGKEAVTDPEPDPTQLCDGFPYLSAFDVSQGVRLGAPPCSRQIGPKSFDDPTGVEPNSTGCALFGPGHGRLHGHMNWWPATVTGVIRWSGQLTGLWFDPTSNSHEQHGDDDYCFYLYPVNGGGLFPHTEMSLGTLSAPNFIEAEMDSDETVDHFGSKWWNGFHEAVDSWSPPWDNQNPLSPSSKMINGHEALITGLVNIDQEHESGHSELHPIYAMAIHLNDGSTEYPRDANDDRWAILARNWGDEGYCSQDQHYWEVSTVSIFIPEQVPASDYAFVELDLVANKPVHAQHGKVPGGLVIKFDLGPPENRAMVDGSLRIRWVPSQPENEAKPSRTAPGGVMASGGPFDRTAASDLRLEAVAAARPEPEALDLLKGLPPDKMRAVLNELKRKPDQARNGVKVEAVRVDMPPGESPHAVERAKFSPPKTRTVHDEALSQERRRQLQILCAAHNNNIPGAPHACSNEVRDHRHPSR